MRAGPNPAIRWNTGERRETSATWLGNPEKMWENPTKHGGNHGNIMVKILLNDTKWPFLRKSTLNGGFASKPYLTARSWCQKSRGWQSFCGSRWDRTAWFWENIPDIHGKGAIWMNQLMWFTETNLLLVGWSDPGPFFWGVSPSWKYDPLRILMECIASLESGGPIRWGVFSWRPHGDPLLGDHPYVTWSVDIVGCVQVTNTGRFHPGKTGRGQTHMMQGRNDVGTSWNEQEASLW